MKELNFRFKVRKFEEGMIDKVEEFLIKEFDAQFIGWGGHTIRSDKYGKR